LLTCERCETEILPGQNVEFVGVDPEKVRIIVGGVPMSHADPRQCPAIRCNCESDSCEHEPGGCAERADGSVRMIMLGLVCARCAGRIREAGGGEYLREATS